MKIRQKLLKFSLKPAKTSIDRKFQERYRVMIEKIGTNNQPLIESGSSTGQPVPPAGLRGNDADVSIQVNYASLVEKAPQPPQTDDQQVQQAPEPLLSGRLEREEIIRGAIENLLTHGI